MQLRPYEANDWAAVCEIYDLAKPDELRGVIEPSSLLPLAADSDMDALFHASQVVVAMDVDRVVGFGGSRDSVITWLFVHPDFRARGIATELVRYMVARLAQMSHPQTRLPVPCTSGSVFPLSASTLAIFRASHAAFASSDMGNEHAA